MRLRAVCGLGRADLRAELIARLRSIIRGRTPRAKDNLFTFRADNIADFRSRGWRPRRRKAVEIRPAPCHFCAQNAVYIPLPKSLITLGSSCFAFVSL